MGRSAKNAEGTSATTASRQISMTDVKKQAKGIKKAVKTLDKLAENNSSVKKALESSNLKVILSGEIEKLKQFALKLAMAEFEAE